MNGHNTEGISAYGPGDEMELMAAILAAHDEADDPAWFEAIGDGDPLPIAPLCPECGGGMVPLPDGRRVCEECGYEATDPAAELAALNGVRFTIEIHTDAIGRPAGWTATAADWDGGDQWEEDEAGYNETVGEGLQRWTR